MQQRFVSINVEHRDEAGPAVERSFSFLAYRRFLEQQMNEGGAKSGAARYLLQQFQKYPGADHDLSPDQLGDYRELLDMVFMSLTDITQDEHQMIWGMSMPFKPDIVYGTDAFYAVLHKFIHQGMDGQRPVTIRKKHNPVREMYATILRRFYDYTYLHGTEEMIHSFTDPDDGLFKYFRFNIDARFIDIRLLKPLPDLPPSMLEAKLCGKDDEVFLQKLLPLDGFQFSGFSVVTLVDVTAQYVIHLIRNLVIRIGSHSGNDIPLNIREELTLSLQTLMGSRDIHFGLIPLYLLNGRPIMEWGKQRTGFLLQALKSQGLQDEALAGTVKLFLNTATPIYYRASDDPQLAPEPLARLMKNAGIQYFALLPVLYNQEVAGFMELYTYEEQLDLESRLYRLDNALPYIAQLITAGVDEVDTKISLTVNELYTSIQPAVQWKFREAAWSYLKTKQLEGERPVAETIRFEQVYPLYGAIDIRNSTLERNRALQDDLQYCLRRLLKLLNIIQHVAAPGSAILFIERTADMLEKFGPAFSESDEHEIVYFLQQDVSPWLRALPGIDADHREMIYSYLQCMDEQTGEGYQNRRALEASMQTINQSIGQYLDTMNEQLQGIYPCYFEKFRTDGVEFDIYMGQSIMPDRPYEHRYLEKAQALQLRAMAAIHRLTQVLLPQMERPLYTTQLIFVNGRSIDISFRNDEKRFDVEGAYNIRYQVIKKRIDKIRVKETGERLTQPGKVAIIYYWNQDAEVYFGHIHALQKEGLLEDDLEQLELEELQGVTGLKAIRIGII